MHENVKGKRQRQTIQLAPAHFPDRTEFAVAALGITWRVWADFPPQRVFWQTTCPSSIATHHLQSGTGTAPWQETEQHLHHSFRQELRTHLALLDSGLSRVAVGAALSIPRGTTALPLARQGQSEPKELQVRAGCREAGTRVTTNTWLKEQRSSLHATSGGPFQGAGAKCINPTRMLHKNESKRSMSCKIRCKMRTRMLHKMESLFDFFFYFDFARVCHGAAAHLGHRG